MQRTPAQLVDPATSSVATESDLGERIDQAIAHAESLLALETREPTLAGRQQSSVSSHEIRRPEVSLVVPVFNEVATVESVIERLLNLPLDAELIVVDDASTDGTRELMWSLASKPRLHYIPKPINEGKGAALHTAFQQAVGSIVVVHDADLEYEPEVIPHLIEPIRRGHADVVYGSRLLDEDADIRSWHRLGNQMLTQLSNWTTGLNLTDMETCQKAFSRQLIAGVTLAQKRFGFEPEITAKLARLQGRFIELPVPYHPRGYQQGKKIGWRDLVSAVYCIVRYGFLA